MSVKTMKNESGEVNNTTQECLQVFFILYFLTIVILNIICCCNHTENLESNTVLFISEQSSVSKVIKRTVYVLPNF